MNRSSRQRHGRVRQRNRVRLVILLSCVCLAALVAGMAVSWRSSPAPVAARGPQHPEDSSGASALAAFVAAVPAAGKEQRLVYPYSVVPGGAKDSQELKEAGDHDWVVADHYHGFDYGKARVVRLKADTPLYVSYRRGSNVYWTRKPHLIPAGETVVTDGKMMARARCGNQLSAKPQAAVSPQEPSEAQMNQPVATGNGTAMDTPYTLGLRSALLPPPEVAGAPTSLPPGPVSGGGGFPSGFPPVFPPGGGGSGGGGNPGPPPPPPPPPPPAPVPEPGTIVLVSTGLAATYALRRKRR